MFVQFGGFGTKLVVMFSKRIDEVKLFQKEEN